MRFCAPTTQLTRLFRNSFRNPPKIDYLFRDERLPIFDIIFEIRLVSDAITGKSDLFSVLRAYWNLSLSVFFGGRTIPHPLLSRARIRNYHPIRFPILIFSP